MKHLHYFLFFLLLLITSCTNKAPLSGTLEMPIEGDWVATVYLIQPRSLDEVAASFTGLLLDSAAVRADGSFAFKKLLDAPDPILLELAVQKKGNVLSTSWKMKTSQWPTIFPSSGKTESHWK